MTNLENIRRLKPKKLAELLIRVVEEPEDDDWDDDEFHWWNTRTWYVTPNDVYCYDMEEAIEVTVRWLSMAYKTMCTVAEKVNASSDEEYVGEKQRTLAEGASVELW